MTGPDDFPDLTILRPACPDLFGLRVLLADVSTVSPDFIQRALAAVPAHRRQKALQLRFDSDRRLSLAAALLFRQLLEELGLPEPTQPPETGPRGKPFYSSLPRLHYNLSHSGSIAMCALARVPLGCDIQEHRALRQDLADRFFSHAEAAALRSAKTDRVSLQYRIWALKESYIKATGEGLYRSLDSFSILTDRPTVILEEDPEGFLFLEPAAPKNYACAVCLNKRTGDR